MTDDPLPISIHAPRVGSDFTQQQLYNLGKGISIHAPRVGSDMQKFRFEIAKKISIHAPRVGSDSSNWRIATIAENFNPRSPCGERPGIGGYGCDL